MASIIPIVGVFLDGSVPDSGKPLVQIVATIHVARATDTTIRLFCRKQNGEPLNVAASIPVLGVRKSANASTEMIARPGNIQGDGTAGIIDFPLVQADTLGLVPQGVFCDVNITILGERVQILPWSPFVIDPVASLPTEPLTSPTPELIQLVQLPVPFTEGAFLRVVGGALTWSAATGRAPAVGALGAVDIEDPVGVLGARRRLTLDDIDPAFTGTFSGTFAVARAMASPLVNPQFTFTASAALSAVAGDVTVTDDTDTQNIAPATSPFGYGAPGALPARSYVSSVRNASKSWDLKLTKIGGSPVIHRFVSAQFQAPVYFGKSSSVGPYDAAFVAGLSSGAVLAATPQRDIATTTGAGEFVFYAHPAADGGTSSDFIDVATGFPFGVTKVAANVSVDNGFGVFVLHDVWRSDFPNLGATTMRRI